jgi:tetratricopeptide (TPR) repeat protein
MRKAIYLFFIAVTFSALIIVDTGCTAKAKRAYHLRQANHYFDAAEYDKAELEYRNVLRGEKNVQAISRLGISYYEQGLYIVAIPFLSEGSQSATNDLDLHLKWGLVLQSLGYLSDAHGQASFVLDKDPLNEEAPLLLAQSVTTKKQIDETRQRLQKLTQGGDKASYEVGLGRLSLSERDFKAAEAAYKSALALDPKSSLAYSELGALYSLQNDLHQADAALKTAFDLSPPRSPRRLEYAQFKIKTGDMEAAKSILGEMVKIIPDYVPAWMELANMAAAQKKYDDCAAFLSKVLARDPGNYDAMMLDGELKLARGQTADAITEFEQLSKIPIYSQLLGGRLLSPVYYKLGLVYLANEDLKNAMNSLNQAVNLNTNYSDAIFLLAQIQIKTKDFNAAIASLKSLIQQQPQIPQAQLLMADAFRGQGNFDSALAIYQRLEKAFPTNSQIPLLMGGSFLQQNNAAEARKAFTRTLELDPDNSLAISELVNLDLNEKQYAAATQRAEQYMDKNPKLVEPRLLLANVFIAQTNNQLAEAALLKAIELQPESSDAHLMLAQLYFDSKQGEKALTELNIVLTKNQKNPLALMLVGQIHQDQKAYQAAASAYEKLFAVDTNSIVALDNLAYLYSEKLGQPDAAYIDAQKAMKLAQKARDFAQKVSDLHPNDQSSAVALASSKFILASTVDTLGWIVYQQDQYASALSLLQESVNILLINKLPLAAEIQFHLGKINYMMGQEESAHAALQSALQLSKDFPGRDECILCLSLLAIDPKTADADARATLEKRVSEKSNDPVALVRLAAIYQREGSVDKAIATYEAALKSNSKNATTLVNLAQLYSSKDVQKALGLARDAYKLSPNDDQAASTLGRLAYATGNYKLAYNLLKQTAQDQPDRPALQYDFGKAAYSIGRVPEASAALQSALQIGLPSSQSAEAKRLLEMITLADNPDRAVAAISQVEEILKSDANYLPALMAMAVIKERKGDVNSAQQTYEKVLTLYSDFAPAQKQLAILYSKDPNNKEKTYPLALKARETFPNDSELAKAIAIVAFQQGEYSRAENLLQASAADRSTDPEPLYFLGMAQYHLKKLTECKKNLQLALNLNLSAQFAPEAKRVLVESK